MGVIKGNGISLAMKIDELTSTLELIDTDVLAKSENAVKSLEKLVRLSEGILQDVDERKR